MFVNSYLDNYFEPEYYSNCFYNRPDLLSKLAWGKLDADYEKQRFEKLTFLKRDVWLSIINKLRTINISSKCALSENNGFLNIYSQDNFDLDSINELVKLLIPWRKGPWSINSLNINSEWRSDFKYKAISELKSIFIDKNIVDVGGGNGYYSFRTILDGAASNIIFDPSEKFFFQFEFIQKFAKLDNVQFELGGYHEALLSKVKFDILFCLGVFYHQKDPLTLIENCKHLLKDKGFALFETMILNKRGNEIFFPPDRYAKARNVYFLPTNDAFIAMLRRSGFKNVDLIEQRETTLDEQRTTEHMPYESLKDFLNPENQSLTIEGYQRPIRSLFIAQAK